MQKAICGSPIQGIWLISKEIQDAAHSDMAAVRPQGLPVSALVLGMLVSMMTMAWCHRAIIRQTLCRSPEPAYYSPCIPIVVFLISWLSMAIATRRVLAPPTRFHWLGLNASPQTLLTTRCGSATALSSSDLPEVACRLSAWPLSCMILSRNDVCWDRRIRHEPRFPAAYAVPCCLCLLQHQQHPEDLGHGRHTNRGMCARLTDSFAGKTHIVKIYA